MHGAKAIFRNMDAKHVILSGAKDQLSKRMADNHSTFQQLAKYTCNNCDFAATQKEVVEKHMKEKHNSKLIQLCQYWQFECKIKGDFFALDLE